VTGNVFFKVVDTAREKLAELLSFCVPVGWIDMVSSVAIAFKRWYVLGLCCLKRSEIDVIKSLKKCTKECFMASLPADPGSSKITQMRSAA
jgi:hypothetical protein